MKKEVERDRSKVAISKISSLGLMEITREMVCNNFSFILNVLDFWLIQKVFIFTNTVQSLCNQHPDLFFQSYASDIEPLK